MDATVYNIFLGVAAVLIAVGFVILAWLSLIHI